MSAESINGHSLNDTLLIGPAVQQDLFSIMLRFCTHQIAFTAYNEMYQKIRVYKTAMNNVSLIRYTNTDLQTPDGNIWDCIKTFFGY